MAGIPWRRSWSSSRVRQIHRSRWIFWSSPVTWDFDLKGPMPPEYAAFSCISSIYAVYYIYIYVIYNYNIYIYNIIYICIYIYMYIYMYMYIYVNLFTFHFTTIITYYRHHYSCLSNLCVPAQLWQLQFSALPGAGCGWRRARQAAWGIHEKVGARHLPWGDTDG